ncbi:hypothetical protein [Butyrivibrio sp. WCD3002]|uniref:hypothetical protein n=1 Tax=Butyrivibrio sp. WCD3002 TaxID=1280676 RepID=UPI0003FAD63F|nr:hypothetical protein [Butyrivibrio sp. WCD3002]
MGGEKSISKGIIIGCIIGVAAIGIAIVIVLVSGKKSVNETEVPEGNKKSVVTAENVEEVVEELTTVEPTNIPQSYTVSQNSEWHFPDGSSETADAFVENIASNETPVYIEVKLNDTNEVVYSSPVIELGAKLTNFKLDKVLDAGTYTCTIDYHLVDDDQNELTQVHVGGTIIIEN